MNMLTTYRPWALFDEMQRGMDTLHGTETKAWTPAVDISEDEHRYVIRADLPGVKPDAIEVGLEGDELTDWGGLYGSRLIGYNHPRLYDPAYAHALLVARRTQDVAAYIHRLRRQSDGYETLILGAAKTRKQVAKALGEDVDVNDIATDVSPTELVRQAAALKDELAQARQRYQDNLAALKAHDADALAEALAAQKQRLTAAQDTTLSSLKDAFKAKLAQETFEADRQAKLRKLFKPGQVEIYVNIDGSLLVRLKALKFAPNQSKVDKAKYGGLIKRLAAALNLYGDRDYRIEGHTDNQGNPRSNQVLSLKRAESVRDMLVADGIDAAKIKSFGYGEVRPIASNAFAKGRAMNRRIDVIIGPPAKAK